MGNIIKNGAIGATVSSVLFIALLALKHTGVSVLYIVFALGLSLAAAFCYGFIAVRLRIYGRGSNTAEKWKNGIVGCSIVVAESLLYTILPSNFPSEVFAATVASSLIAMAISDALA